MAETEEYETRNRKAQGVRKPMEKVEGGREKKAGQVRWWYKRKRR